MKPSASYLRHGRREFVTIVLLLVPAALLAQPDRIHAPIDRARTTFLSGNVHPKAQRQFDRGAVDPAFQLDSVTLSFKTSPPQQSALQQLIREQQDPSSQNYRRWLTPEQYADQFGLSPADLAKTRAWLESQGFSIQHVARSRNWLAFSGTAAQIAQAFHTEIHRYEVAGESHFANATEPAIPDGLASIVRGFLGLDDFRPQHTARRSLLVPRLTLGSGDHVLAPDDLATIYDLNRLYQAGLDGTGITLVVVGQSNIDLSDIATFQSDFKLSSNVPQIKQAAGSADPGTNDSEGEADLDVEWAGAVARNATILYVKATNAAVAAAFSISERLGSVVSYSFGGCESSNSLLARQTVQSIADQGNSEGITWVAAAGDSGAAGCDKPFANASASRGLAVSFPADLEEVTAIGGTSFNEATGAYWSVSNTRSGLSVLSYIPETAWNESDSNGLASTGGGFSRLYPAPSWQVGPGLASLPGRAVPDVALASAMHDGYVTVSGGQTYLDYGTSTGTPVFSGIVALLDQKEQSGGVGNVNPNLYRLAQTNAFHDVTTGNNIVPCTSGSADCNGGLLGYQAGPAFDPVTGLGSLDAYNLIMGWHAATPASKVVAGSTPNPVPQQPADAQGNGWFYTVSLTETAGVATSLTGFTVNGDDHTSEIAGTFGSSTVPAFGTISANYSSAGMSVPIVFGFTGVDAGGQQWSKQLTVTLNGMSQSTPTPPSIGAVVNAASFKAGLPAGALATIFGTHLSSVNGVESPGGAISYKGVSVTVGGRLAPLFAVANVNGQEQINFQVPTGLSTANAPVQVNNNGSVGAMSAPLSVVQPGIFEYVPSGSATPYGVVAKLDGSVIGLNNPAPRGSTVVLYATGLGPTSPALATSQAGPIPPAYTTNTVTVGINGIDSPVLFSGAAPFFIGLNQVNFTIPADAPVGTALTVTVAANGISSPPTGIAIK